MQEQYWSQSQSGEPTVAFSSNFYFSGVFAALSALYSLINSLFSMGIFFGKSGWLGLMPGNT